MDKATYNDDDDDPVSGSSDEDDGDEDCSEESNDDDGRPTSSSSNNTKTFKKSQDDDDDSDYDMSVLDVNVQKAVPLVNGDSEVTSSSSLESSKLKTDNSKGTKRQHSEKVEANISSKKKKQNKKT